MVTKAEQHDLDIVRGTAADLERLRVLSSVYVAGLRGSGSSDPVLRCRAGRMAVTDFCRLARGLEQQR